MAKKQVQKKIVPKAVSKKVDTVITKKQRVQRLLTRVQENILRFAEEFFAISQEWNELQFDLQEEDLVDLQGATNNKI